MSIHDYIAEVSPAAASGETARIYGEIRRLTGGPLVALIYRHLATLPGVLEALWAGVAPLLERGLVQEPAWALAREAWNGPVPDASAALAGLAAPDRQAADAVLAAYNRANPVNFVVVGMIRFALAAEGRGITTPPPPQAWTPPPPLPAIVAIPAMDDLPGPVRAQVDAFAKRETPDAVPLVPTLYRHVGHWPALTGLAHRDVLPRLADGRFAAAIGRFSDHSQALAADLARRHAPVLPDALRAPAAQAVLERFSVVIPEMVVVGHFLRATLGAARSPA